MVAGEQRLKRLAGSVSGPWDLSSRKGFLTPRPIPPRSVVELIRADKGTPAWKQQVGRQFRIGYYSPQDGLDTVWLVDAAGKYCQTTDHEYLAKYFRIVRVSRETDFYGARRAKLRRLRPRSKIRRRIPGPHPPKVERPR